MSIPSSSDASAASAQSLDTAVPASSVLEKDVPLSQSLIWRRQRDFYVQRGLKAWTDDRVPSYITNNPFTAELYARIVFAFLKDAIELTRNETHPLSPAHPLRILELGAGSGKFSFLFLRELTALLRAHNIPAQSVRYCMTDCAPAVVDEWSRNVNLGESASTGILEFERFQSGEPIQSAFLAGRSPASLESLRGPLVVIANYVFDSLPNDAFVIQSGEISESLVTTSLPASGSEAGPETPPIVGYATSRLAFSFTNNPVAPQRYANSIWNKLLDGYRGSLPSGTTILFPCGALSVLETITRFSGGRMLVLAGDKGCAYREELALSQGAPAFEFHAPDCFSQMVNFDALEKYFEAIGGHALLPEKHAPSFSICGFLAHRTEDRFTATESAYHDIQESFGPEDLFALLAWLNAHMEEMNVPQILAALRLTRWDATALMRLFPVLAPQLRTVVSERHDLREAVLRTWRNHYPLRRTDNVLAFQCGVILLELRFFEEAISMFRASDKLLGPSAPNSYNLGLAAKALGRHKEALDAMKEACRLDPNFQPAQDSLCKLEDRGPGS